MLKEDKYNALNRDKVNSWAIWPDNFNKTSGSHKRFEWSEVNQYLKPDVIFLGLNPSKDLVEYDLVNFHNPKSPNDRKLKESIQGAGWEKPECERLFGAFMTDIVQNESIADSSQVEVKPEVFKAFEEQLEVLGQQTYHFVCFGNKTYEAVQRWLLQEDVHKSGLISGHTAEMKWDIHIYKVVHFAASIKKKIFQDQLNELNALLKT